VIVKKDINAVIEIVVIEDMIRVGHTVVAVVVVAVRVIDTRREDMIVEVNLVARDLIPKRKQLEIIIKACQEKWDQDQDLVRLLKKVM
jgi:hypothetical protein